MWTRGSGINVEGGPQIHQQMEKIGDLRRMGGREGKKIGDLGENIPKKVPKNF